ncbi:MAG: GH32 C-terminal domain-containing protein [Phycisphaerae bacterium]|nr:GH32 C-terminal domain-containing protein [Phycisphaerae bacterium]
MKRIVILTGLLAVLAATGVARAATDIVIADFEGKTYGDWKVTGEAFGPGPAKGKIGGQKPVSGFKGKGLVNTFFQGDKSVGTLTSPEITVERKYIAFLIGGGCRPKETCINLLVDGKVVQSATGLSRTGGDSETLVAESFDVTKLMGKKVVLQIVDASKGGWGHINIDHIIQTNTKTKPRPKVAPGAAPIQAGPLYREQYRPQFHFTAMKNWLNDPNGLVYYKGEYHLFFQHNPKSTRWGNMTWGHAVSTDLVHWKQLDHALHPDKHGVCFSGSAVIDWKNTAGFQSGQEKVIVAIYTSHGRGERQSLGYSNDRGRTWKKYEGNPVLKDRDRDPKVMWHEPTGKWVMSLFSKGGVSFYSSPNLKKWTFMSNIKGFHECPDLFELAVDPPSSPGDSGVAGGDAKNTRWVLHGGSAGKAVIGKFDGTKFTPEGGTLRFDYGRNYYAAQSFSDIPKADGRRIQIGWMKGGRYPGMPFNQQMSFPTVLTLRTTGKGIRICRNPVKEIEVLRTKEHSFADKVLKPGQNLLKDVKGELFEIKAEVELAGAKAFGIRARGQAINYDVAGKTLTALGAKAPLEPIKNRIKLHILLDRCTLEVFGNDGLIAMSSCFLYKPEDKSLEIYATGGDIKVVSLKVYELKSAWPQPKASK